MSPAQTKQARNRTSALASAKKEKQASAIERDLDADDGTKVRFSGFMRELSSMLPQDAVVFDEALTNSPALTRYFPPKKPGRFFQTRGGSLGVGVAGAIGLKLARPRDVVLAVCGDGGTMYTIQALWTLSRHQLNAKIVICNNRSYKLLQANIAEWWSQQGVTPHAFPDCFDLSRPEIRFDELAAGMGVESVRVETPAEIRPAIERMLGSRGPFLIDLMIDEDDHPAGPGRQTRAKGRKDAAR